MLTSEGRNSFHRFIDLAVAPSKANKGFQSKGASSNLLNGDILSLNWYVVFGQVLASHVDSLAKNGIHEDLDSCLKTCA